MRACPAPPLTPPILVPLMLGLDFGLGPQQVLAWFGTLGLVSVEAGMISPPFGMNLFVINAMARDVPMAETCRGGTGFVVSDVVRIVLLTLVPWLSLWLPGLLQPAGRHPPASPFPILSSSRPGPWLSGRMPRTVVTSRRALQVLPRPGFIQATPVSRKCRSFAVATVSPCAVAVAATIMSVALRGRPAAVPSAIKRAHSRAARSSKGRTRPANRVCGPSDPANQFSSSRRRRPGSFSRMPLRISATVSIEMQRLVRLRAEPLGQGWRGARP